MSKNKRSIKADYLRGKDFLQPFYQYSPIQTDFLSIIQDKSREFTDRNTLYESLGEQYAGIDMGPEVSANLEALKSPNTFTITTGHQLIVYGGPLFTFYKVLHVILLAKHLEEQYPDYRFVPVFWIHTEDHDYEEINHYFTDFDEKKVYQGIFSGSVGEHVLTEEIQAIAPAHFPSELKACFAPGLTLARAFRLFFHTLFKQDGLVILDPDHPKLKARFQSVLINEFTHYDSGRLIEANTHALEEAGYPAQITTREINFFYKSPGIRNRIVAQGENFSVIDTPLSFSREEMFRLIRTQPERFSPNVSLRPLYQEILLPNLAYIGGWGEIAYWLQLKNVFDHYQTNFPLLLPRFSATLFRAEQAEAWKNLGFQLADIEKNLQSLNAIYMPRVWDKQPYDNLVMDLNKNMEALGNYIQTFSQTLPRAVIGQKVKNQAFLDNLQKKLERVIREQHPVFSTMRDLKNTIQPDGQVQERILSLASFPYTDPYRLIEKIGKACKPTVLQPAYIELIP